MEQNDAQASQDVQRLRSMLSTPDELADLLHLIDGWQVVVNWRERPTRLAVELGELEDSLKKKILASWQAQLAQALQEADFPRLQALKEALTRMRNMGIFPEERSEYREHARQLQAALLDLAFEQLSRSDDFSKMLENRQQRLRLCRQQDERQKVQGEIRAVHRRRALMELHRASSAESDIAPLFWQYIRSPELGKDAELVEGFIRQALANSALDKILAVAKGFQWMGASDMWWDALKELLTGFYQAASKLEAGELSLARAELDHTRNALQGTPQLRTLLESMWEQLIDSRVDNLFREADNARRALPRVLALTRIAKLRPDDPRLRVRFHGRGHLQELEDEVTQELERLKKQPLRFVDGPYLRKTIEDMERTTQDLDDLLQSEVLQTGDARYWREDLQEENRLVKDVVSKLRILNRRYQEYKKLLEDATHTPIFEAGKGYQWNLNPVRTALEHIQRLVNEIRGIRGFDIQVLSHEIQTLREDFERRKEYASKLNKLINDLMEYLRQEQIDAAYNTVLALEHAWDAARSHEFDGLHFALEYQYPSSSETVSTIQGHKKQLEAISTNLALWQDLQDAMNKKYEELMEMAQDLGETLDEAREFYSLNEIIKKSEEILQSIEKFQRNYKPQSISPPRSEQARSCKNAIEALVSQSKNLYSRYQRMRDDSDSLLKENSEKRERLKKVTQNLRRALREAEKPRSFLSRRNKKSISSIAIDNVQKALSEYEKIDPKSPVVTEARELLSKAEQP
ncbi:MAG: hypothetical protein D6694_14050 [Gammaproteobacteria bacterium]|nr:MAG: hypothetical protein D6694_14050 [Gammaproteobacteria bacterium]